MFWADDGLDTGPILLQRECDVDPNDTVNTIYKRFLFPEGVKGTVRLLAVIPAALVSGLQQALTHVHQPVFDPLPDWLPRAQRGLSKGTEIRMESCSGTTSLNQQVRSWFAAKNEG